MTPQTNAGRRVIRLGTTMAFLALALTDLAHAQRTLSALDAEVNNLALAARPSVVTVIAERNEPVRARTKSAKQRVRLRIGSGVAVAEDVIITTASVVMGSDRFVVHTSNGLRIAAELIGADPIFNVAVLRVHGVRLPPLTFAKGRPGREGEWAMAIGTSHYSMRISESVGSIAYRHQEPRIPLLELTNTVYPGYSGGAVLNIYGELIGIVLGQLGGLDAPGRVDASSGRRSFVLTAETVRYVSEKLLRDGHVPHGYLGVSTRAAAVESATEPGLSIPIGAKVVSTVPGSPAQAIGLEPGDVIVGFERDRVEFPQQLARWVAASAPETMVRLVWVRNELQHTGLVELSESPQAMPQWALRGTDGAAPANRMQISDLERRIQTLSDELQRLKAAEPSAPR